MRSIDINRELFLKIADIIENHSEHYCQGVWSSHPETCLEPVDDSPNHAVVTLWPEFDLTQVGECKTIACIAGWAIHLTPSADRPHTSDVHYAARYILGLTSCQASWLFSESYMKGFTKAEVAAELRMIADGCWPACIES